MAKKKTKSEPKTVLSNEIFGVLTIGLGLIFGVAVFSSAGTLLMGWLRRFVFGLFGVLGYVFPFLILGMGILAIVHRKKKIKASLVFYVVLGAFSLFTFLQLCYQGAFSAYEDYFSYLGACYRAGGEQIIGGGIFGGILGFPMGMYLGAIPGMILMAVLFFVAMMLITRVSIKKAGKDLGNKFRKTIQNGDRIREQRAKRYQEDSNMEYVYEAAFSYPKKQKRKQAKMYIDEVDAGDHAGKELKSLLEETEFKSNSSLQDPIGYGEKEFSCLDDRQENLQSSAMHFQPEKSRKISAVSSPVQSETPSATPNPEKEEQQNLSHQEPETGYRKPPLALLDASVLESGKGKENLQQKAALLENTLKSFSISAKVIHVSSGPVITRFELQPAPGVKVSRIVGLADDLALNLAARSIRIEAPIPGKAAIGIEIPNGESGMVKAIDLLGTSEFQGMKSSLAFAVGKDISGKNIYADLAKMPHMLIAGATGSGKSVCINGFVMSILFHATPEEVRFIMIDPKVVELRMFNDIPHMLRPVVTDPKDAAKALSAAVTEMINRYKRFADKGVKDLDRFNALARQNGEETLPKWIIVIDELADLMMVSANEVEDAICRIAQLGRASGIHLVVATQRPSVDVITGLIKANIPSRIAFAVSSQVDSRTILDMGGAEKLLGHGDMLYFPAGVNKPLRVQGFYTSDGENEAVLDFMRNQGAEYDQAFMESMAKATVGDGKKGKQESGFGSDDLIPKAIETALEYEQVSISMLQRRLRVGYARAARLVDEMEEMHVVSPADGSKPRQVLISWDDYHHMFETQEGTDHEN